AGWTWSSRAFLPGSRGSNAENLSRPVSRVPGAGVPTSRAGRLQADRHVAQPLVLERAGGPDDHRPERQVVAGARAEQGEQHGAVGVPRPEDAGQDADEEAESGAGGEAGTGGRDRHGTTVPGRAWRALGSDLARRARAPADQRSAPHPPAPQAQPAQPAGTAGTGREAAARRLTAPMS